MNEFSAFIESNRQLGSTTRLVETAIGCDGYIIVGNQTNKKHIIAKHPTMNPKRIITIHELERGEWKGGDSRPVFVDAACMCLLQLKK